MLTSSSLPVSFYFTWQWWERHYQSAFGRPKSIDMDWLDKTYLGRQRQLHEWFGDYGIGSVCPELDLDFVSMILPYHTIIVPTAMGLRTGIQEVGGYCWQYVSEDQMRSLVPVNIADTPVAEVIYEERKRRIDRYGLGRAMIDLASAANNAFTLRGPEFYADLMAEPGFANDYMQSIVETMCLAHKFVTDLFGPAESFPLANCNVVMMSPSLYVEQVRKYDIQCVNYAATLTGKRPSCDIHHCSVNTEPFAEAYSAIPGLRSLQGSDLSDLPKIQEALPDVTFSAMVSPVDLVCKPEDQVRAEIDKCVRDGAQDLAIWDVDPEYGPEQVYGLMKMISEIGAAHGRQPAFSVIPITWEELDWEFPVYRQ
jgi:hypothetical protein